MTISAILVSSHVLVSMCVFGRFCLPPLCEQRSHGNGKEWVASRVHIKFATYGIVGHTFRTPKMFRLVGQEGFSILDVELKLDGQSFGQLMPHQRYNHHMSTSRWKARILRRIHMKISAILA